MKWGALAALAVAVAVGAFFYGFYAHKHKLAPFYNLISRVERKLNKVEGGPSETEQRVSLLETTFLQLRGEVWMEPDNDWISGGAMTVWAGDLVVLDHRGRLFRFVDGKGLVRLDIAVPDNGLAGYRALMASPKYNSYPSDPDRVRYNDITYVSAPDGRTGLALSYTYIDLKRDCYASRVSWLPLGPGDTAAGLRVSADAWQTLFETEPCQPFNLSGTEDTVKGIFAGGRMVFKAPSTLYYAAGYYGLDGIRAYDAGLESDASDYGKIIAIDIATKTDRIVSKGHRNPQGLTLDDDGRLWEIEHGPRGGDELNLIEPGVDYGFPSVTLGTAYSGLPEPHEGRYGHHDGFRKPVFSWLPSTAPSALMTIHGIDESWDGDLLAGSLSSEEFGQSLWHIRIDGERVVFAERIRLGRRVRYLQQYGDRIAAWLDSNELVLFRAERRADPLKATLAALTEKYGADVANTVAGILASCNECHSFVAHVTAAGPSLNGVVGRRIAATPFDGYSEALKAKGGRWDAARLKAFLSDPNGFAADTPMPDPGLAGKDKLIDAIIWALQQTDASARHDLTYD